MKKTNFDRYLEAQKRDPAFASRFKQAEKLWDVANPPNAASGDAAYNTVLPADVGRLPPAGGSVGRVPPRGEALPDPSVGPVPSPGSDHLFTRIERAWRWQAGFHDHKLRSPESETRKWEYVCLNPVRYHLVQRPEDWPYGGEIFYDEAGGPRLVRGTPPLLETGSLIEEDGTPRGGARPTT